MVYFFTEPTNMLDIRAAFLLENYLLVISNEVIQIDLSIVYMIS